MGLFNRNNDAEKKLKELTGGFLLSSSYIDLLKRKNIELTDGNKIKNQIKDEIKRGIVTEDKVEIRLNQLIHQYSSASGSKMECPKCGTLQDSSNIYCIECGNKLTVVPESIKRTVSKSKKKIIPDFKKKSSSTKICPICRRKQDSSNNVCIKCGYNFVKKRTSPKYKACPNCNKSLFDNTMICPGCHFDFKTSKMPKYTKKCPNCFKIQDAENEKCFFCKLDLTDIDYVMSDDLITCPECSRKIPDELDICPFCEFDLNSCESKDDRIKREAELKVKEDFIRKTGFLSNFEFNFKVCPECNTKFLKVDPFCFNCGASVVTTDTVKNDNLEVRDGKLVKQTDTKTDDELSGLEALYNQAVKSNYAPAFKVAYVLFLNAFKENPTKKFPEKTAKKYETTPNKLKKQAIEDEFIELASPLLAAKDFKVTELKEILKKHDLKVSGKKDELIERLGENLTDDELKKYFKSKNYQISQKGEEFLAKNSFILYIKGDNDISKALYPAEIGKIFEEKEYSQDEIHERLLKYFKDTLDKKLTQELWVDFKVYSNAVAQVQEDMGDLTDALNTRFKVFLFDINNYSVVMDKPDPKKVKLKQKDMTKLMSLLHEMTLPIEELKIEFEKAFNETLFKTAITAQDSLIYLLKIFGGEDLNEVSKEISESYSNPY